MNPTLIDGLLLLLHVPTFPSPGRPWYTQVASFLGGGVLASCDWKKALGCPFEEGISRPPEDAPFAHSSRCGADSIGILLFEICWVLTASGGWKNDLGWQVTLFKEGISSTPEEAPFGHSGLCGCISRGRALDDELHFLICPLDLLLAFATLPGTLWFSRGDNASVLLCKGSAVTPNILGFNSGLSRGPGTPTTLLPVFIRLSRLKPISFGLFCLKLSLSLGREA
jgi:hypothetical protein